MPYYVYLTTNPAKTVLYIGITSRLSERVAEHYANRGTSQSFAGRYFCYNLVRFEEYTDSKAAIAREKELKG
jgi:putative endonuclease